jgi:carboxyl-terminal processing protease
MITWLVALGLASAPSVSESLSNGDFKNGVAGWQVDAADEQVRFSVSQGHARLHTPSGSSAGSMTIAIQKVDAISWRGRTVQLTARVRILSGAAGIRFAAVHDQPTRRLVRVISPAGTLKPDGKWHIVRVHGRIGADADYLNTGLYVVGATDADFDDVRLELYLPPKRPTSAYASKVLTKALDKIQQLHVNARDNKLWSEMKARARRDAAGAQTTADLAPAITALLGDLNEHHALLETPEDVQAITAQQGATTYRPPSVTLVEGSLGYVMLPGFNLSRHADVEPAKSYIRTVRTGLEDLDSKPLCGWIVDLRDDDGGTTQVMASAVAGLALFDIKDWPDEYADDISMASENYHWLMTEGRHQLSQADKPVALLIGGQTGSAGEDTALRFIGRPRTRSFGSPTAGFTSSNERAELADGYTLYLPNIYMHDREGNAAKDRLMPDEPSDDPIDAAKRWLFSQCK